MRYVALLRAINVGGAAKLPMAQLRELCGEIGWEGVRTYIQSGNVVFDAPDDAGALEAALEQAVEKRFGFFRPVLVRSADEWRAYAGGSPFPDLEAEQANRIMLCLSKRPLAEGAAELLQARAASGELVREKARGLWVYYPGGAGTTKLTPALFDKAAGSPVTARNWRTICKLQEMLAAGTQ